MNHHLDPSMNMHTQLYCGARGLNDGMNLHLDPSLTMHTQLNCEIEANILA